jgi:hypothetical protein
MSEVNEPKQMHFDDGKILLFFWNSNVFMLSFYVYY